MNPGGHEFDAIILTDARYVNPVISGWYVENVLKEDRMLQAVLEKRGFRTGRLSWDDPDFDWRRTRIIIFRSTWDYFERGPEFSDWLDGTSKLTRMVNPYETIRWNMDKHYLSDLSRKGINIPPTLFIETGDPRSLAEVCSQTDWREMILKPAVGGGARHTYRIDPDTVHEHEELYQKLISEESMLLQQFQESVLEEGEMAYMVFGGRFSHAVKKKARRGDFRVQDDWGGSVHDHHASAAEIEFAENVVYACDPLPVYARVDVIRDTRDTLCVSELELIEPELWFRRYPAAVEMFVEAFVKAL